MSLDELADDLNERYRGLDDDDLAVGLDGETKHELAMLMAAMEPNDPDELVRRAVHVLFQSTVETGKLDFHLRSTYGITYDEYLSGMTYDEMSGGVYQGGAGPQSDDRRYQF
jgi:hypothetical protein